MCSFCKKRCMSSLAHPVGSVDFVGFSTDGATPTESMVLGSGHHVNSGTANPGITTVLSWALGTFNISDAYLSNNQDIMGEPYVFSVHYTLQQSGEHSILINNLVLSDGEGVALKATFENGVIISGDPPANGESEGMGE